MRFVVSGTDARRYRYDFERRFMTTVAACILLGIGALNALLNWGGIVAWYTAGKRSSLIPFVGGLFGFAGCALLPPIGWKFGLLALALDPGCSLLAPYPFVWMVRRLRSRRKS